MRKILKDRKIIEISCFRTKTTTLNGVSPRKIQGTMCIALRLPLCYNAAHDIHMPLLPRRDQR